MCLDMFLQILGSLEGFATEFTLVWLQRDVDSNMRSDVVALDGSRSALTPCACQVEVVGRLSADMSFTYMLLSSMVSFCEIEIQETHRLHIEPLVFGIARRILAIGIVSFRLRR